MATGFIYKTVPRDSGRSATFDGTGADYALSNPTVTGVPLTMACWFKTGALGAEGHLMSLFDVSAVQLFTFGFGIAGAGSNAKVSAGTYSSGWATADSPNLDANTWYHGVAVYAAINDRKIYVGGKLKATNTSSKTPTGIDTYTVGCQGYSGSARVNFFDGKIKHPAIWSAALTHSEIKQLFAGASPEDIRPGNLAYYHQIPNKIGRGGVLFTDGTPLGAPAPMFVKPQKRYIPVGVAAAAAAAATTGFITRKIPWTKKPPQRGLISLLQPQYKDRLTYFVGAQERQGAPKESSSNLAVTWTGTEKFSTLPDGSSAIEFSATSDIALDVTANVVATNEAFTAVWIGVPLWDGTDREGLFGWATYAPGVMMGDNGTPPKWGVYWGAWFNSSVAPIVGKLQTVVLKRDAGSACELWVDGQLILSFSNAASLGTVDLHIGSVGPGASAFSDASKLGAFLFYAQREFTASEIRTVSSNPWGQLFQPLTQYLPVGAAAAAAAAAAVMYRRRHAGFG